MEDDFLNMKRFEGIVLSSELSIEDEKLIIELNSIANREIEQSVEAQEMLSKRIKEDKYNYVKDIIKEAKEMQDKVEKNPIDFNTLFEGNKYQAIELKSELSLEDEVLIIDLYYISKSNNPKAKEAQEILSKLIKEDKYNNVEEIVNEAKEIQSDTGFDDRFDEYDEDDDDLCSQAEALLVDHIDDDEEDDDEPESFFIKTDEEGHEEDDEDDDLFSQDRDVFLVDKEGEEIDEDESESFFIDIGEEDDDDDLASQDNNVVLVEQTEKKRIKKKVFLEK